MEILFSPTRMGLKRDKGFMESRINSEPRANIENPALRLSMRESKGALGMRT
jgi:hypothetical protein